METFKQRQQRLTAEEIRILHALNIGYGNLIENASKIGLHVNTYRYILRRGSGRRENIMKIRSLLLMHPADESSTPQSSQD